MLALIHDAAIVSTVYAGGWFDFPDGSRASPAQDGWSSGRRASRWCQRLSRWLMATRHMRMCWRMRRRHPNSNSNFSGRA